MKTLEEQFYEYAVVPVVVLNDADDALPLAKALIEGGLPCAEVIRRSWTTALLRIFRSFPVVLHLPKLHRL